MKATKIPFCKDIKAEETLRRVGPQSQGTSWRMRRKWGGAECAPKPPGTNSSTAECSRQCRILSWCPTGRGALRAQNDKRIEGGSHEKESGHARHRADLTRCARAPGSTRRAGQSRSQTLAPPSPAHRCSRVATTALSTQPQPPKRGRLTWCTLHPSRPKAATCLADF